MSKEEAKQEIIDDIDKEREQYVNLKYKITEVINCLEDSREGILAMYELEKAKERVNKILSEINGSNTGKALKDVSKKMAEWKYSYEIGNIPFYDEEEYEDGENNEPF